MKKAYFKRFVGLFVFAGIVFHTQLTVAQAPHISYADPQTYSVGSAITPLTPSNSGGAVAAHVTTVSVATSLYHPAGMVMDASNNIYLADQFNHRILKINPSTGAILNTWGSGSAGYTDATGTSAAFYNPAGVAIDNTGSYLYVSDYSNNVIRRIDLSTNAVTTFAGSGTAGELDAIGTGANFNGPLGIIVGDGGNIYVADYTGQKIRKITPSAVVSTVAGSGYNGTANGVGGAASFDYPSSLREDAANNLYITDRSSDLIRKIDLATSTVSKVSGIPYNESSVDGSGAVASFYRPSDLTFDASGNLYITDYLGNVIRKMNTSGTVVVATIAGGGSAGSSDGYGSGASFNGPFGIVTDGSGNMFVSDIVNNAIRKISPAGFSISPALPAGLVFNTVTGTISGTPTASSGPVTYTITATNATGPYSTNLTITINGSSLSAPSNSQNYVVTYTPRIEISDITQIAGAPVTQVNQTVQYMDGLGRPVQTVQFQASPTFRDIVQPIAYDQYGREANSYLPYTVLPSAPSDASFKANAISDQASFYANTTNTSTWNAPGVIQTSFPIAQTSFEPSPLDRVVEKGSPGDAWQLPGTPGTTNGGHTVRVSYATNNSTTPGSGFYARAYSGDAILSYNGTNFFISPPALTDLGSYAVGQLSVIVTKDENWPTNTTYLQVGTTEEYKNNIGQTVLKRTYNYNTATASLETLSTYYVYDYSGNLTFVLPPGANPDAGLTSATNQATLDTWCYQYAYDGRNRYIKKKIPGKGAMYFIYNTQDQLVATQDANQQANNQWIYTKYDAFGRIVKTGVWTDNYSDLSADYLQAQVNTQGIIWESRTPGNDYTNVAWPTTNTVDYTVNYYDDYNIPGIPTSYIGSGSTNMQRGLATASKTAVLNTPTDLLWKVTYYDDKNQPIQIYQQHYLGGAADVRNYDVTLNTYAPITDDITNTSRSHYTTASTTSPAVTISNTYVYDHVGRKMQTKTSINGAPDVLQNKTDYNEIGQLTTKHLHSTDGGSTFLQSVNYTYNERGWLRNSATTDNLFNMELKYDNATIPQYNGNIGQMNYLTTHVTSPGNRTFNYTYDALNRLTNAAFTGGQTGDALDETINYDVMGNITQLTRNGTGGGTLNYTIYTGNQLNTVTGYSARNYGYDPNGNATSDGLGKGITYNMLNSIQTVTSGTTTLATYVYNASGEKIRNIGSDGSWDYINGIVYHNGAMAFITTEEGRVAINSGVYNYEYNLKDHLGSIRVSIDQYAGSARVIQEDEYYSFGLRKPTGRYDLSNDNRYLYNGKEIQKADLGDQYDYGNRFYDPVIARFSSVDPKADEERRMSDYSYAIDNPIRFVDVDGDGPGDRVKAALQMTGTPYPKSAEPEKLRTAQTAAALALKDCSEFVMRVLAADGITNGVISLSSSAMVTELPKMGFVHSMQAQVGDIALWKGHVGIVGAVDKDGNIKLIAARGVKKPAGENGSFQPPSIYADGHFYGYYRPVKETPDGKKIDVNTPNDNSNSNISKSKPTKKSTQNRSNDDDSPAAAAFRDGVFHNKSWLSEELRAAEAKQLMQLQQYKIPEFNPYNNN